MAASTNELMRRHIDTYTDVVARFVLRCCFFSRCCFGYFFSLFLILFAFRSGCLWEYMRLEL